METVPILAAALFAVLWLVMTWRARAAARRSEARIAELEAEIRELKDRLRPRAIEPAPRLEPEPEPKPEPEAEPPPEREASPEIDRLRPLAAKTVREAFEMCRYLDFNALVDDDNPSVYRTTMLLTAANAEVLRYLRTGMFDCLLHFELKGDTAIFHIDMSRGTP